MLHLPKAPNTLISRPLECVSCQEQFTVAEDDNSSQQTPRWRLASDHFPHSQLRYEANISARPTIPETRAGHSSEAVDTHRWDRNRRSQIICPRCGTDNRNWLRLLSDTKSRGFRERSAHIILGLIIALINILIVSLIYWADASFRSKTTISEMVALITTILIGGCLTAWLPMREWKKRRQQINRKKYLPIKTRQQLEPHFLWRNVLLSLVLIFAVPVVLFSILPEIIRVAPQLANPLASRPTPARITYLLNQFETEPKFINEATAGQIANLQQATNVLETAVYRCDPDVAKETSRFLKAFHPFAAANKQPELSELIVQIDNYGEGTIPFCRPDELQEALDKLIALQRLEDIEATCLTDRNRSCRDEMLDEVIKPLREAFPEKPFASSSLGLREQTLQALRDSHEFLRLHPTAIATEEIEAQLVVMEDIVVPSIEGKPTSRTFFANWLIFVTIVCIGGTFVGFIAVDSRAKGANGQLPRPLYASVANMTRVVIWEAKRAAEIQQNLANIQWMNVTRNKQGGIDLTGVERQVPDYDAKTNNLSNRVRGQRYTISSDLWGRISSIEIKDVKLPRSLVGPSYVLPLPERAPQTTVSQRNGRLVLERRE